jgi:hypothetical protein
VFDGGEVGWGVIGADAALVVAESHIHDPVQSLASGCGPKPLGGLERISSVDGPELLAKLMAAAVDPADRALFGRIVALGT